MTAHLYDAILHTILSFLSLCICFSPSLVCAYIENKHTLRVFLINLGIFVVLFLLILSAVLVFKPLSYGN